ncbi:hypothetical protein MUK42_17995 [Musa troglodytarum]|uniref:Uncharacterized protein n=1 Tax=Musa troglodytarum TaxID=320322 RepID=A0A9E7HN52_9LILI|nr:hypothetical protein MUK42_17995 [Musa troglodytarum]
MLPTTEKTSPPAAVPILASVFSLCRFKETLILFRRFRPIHGIRGRGSNRQGDVASSAAVPTRVSLRLSFVPIQETPDPLRKECLVPAPPPADSTDQSAEEVSKPPPQQPAAEYHGGGSPRYGGDSRQLGSPFTDATASGPDEPVYSDTVKAVVPKKEEEACCIFLMVTISWCVIVGFVLISYITLLLASTGMRPSFLMGSLEPW